MATSVMQRFNQPIYNRNRSNTIMQPQPQRDLAEIIDKVRQLQQLTKTTGFFTSRSIGALLNDLTPDELVQVNRAINPKL
jgi:hypothetical protein